MKLWKNSKYAILLTIVIHVGFFLYMNVSKMKISKYIPKNITFIELDYTEEEIIEEENKKTMEEEIIAESNQSIKDLARDIADIRRKNNRSYTEEEIENEVLQEILNRNNQDLKEREDAGKGFDPEKFNLDNPKEKSDLKKKETSSKSNQVAGSVTVTCSVPGRKCYVRKKPTFKCEAGGRVYVNIKVDKIGRVKSASINDFKSTTSNQCLIDNALKYAKNYTKVKADLTGGKSNEGYIIYNFIEQ